MGGKVSTKLRRQHFLRFQIDSKNFIFVFNEKLLRKMSSLQRKDEKIRRQIFMNLELVRRFLNVYTHFVYTRQDNFVAWKSHNFSAWKTLKNIQTNFDVFSLQTSTEFSLELTEEKNDARKFQHSKEIKLFNFLLAHDSSFTSD